MRCENIRGGDEPTLASVA